jgi:hypothetical protein
MNQPLRFAGTAMPGLSTDQIALSVNRFIAQRQTLTSRPETNEERCPAGAPVPPELLYPSLYAKHSSLVQRCGAYFRVIVITLGNRHSPNATQTS